MLPLKSSYDEPRQAVEYTVSKKTNTAMNKLWEQSMFSDIKNTSGKSHQTVAQYGEELTRILMNRDRKIAFRGEELPENQKFIRTKGVDLYIIQGDIVKIVEIKTCSSTDVPWFNQFRDWKQYGCIVLVTFNYSNLIRVFKLDDPQRLTTSRLLQSNNGSKSSLQVPVSELLQIGFELFAVYG